MFDLFPRGGSLMTLFMIVFIILFVTGIVVMTEVIPRIENNKKINQNLRLKITFIIRKILMICAFSFVPVFILISLTSWPTHYGDNGARYHIRTLDKHIRDILSNKLKSELSEKEFSAYFYFQDEIVTDPDQYQGYGHCFPDVDREKCDSFINRYTEHQANNIKANISKYVKQHSKDKETNGYLCEIQKR